MMTLQQFGFVGGIREAYFTIFGESPFEKQFAAADDRGDDLETARLAGMVIIAMDLGGVPCVHAAKRWLELFEPTVPLAS